MLNQIIINGFVVKDSELKNAGDKGEVLIFSIAHNQRVKNPNGHTTKRAIFIEVNLFGTLARALFPHIKKGKEVELIGKFDISYCEYNGEKQSKPFIRASEIILRGTNEQNERI